LRFVLAVLAIAALATTTWLAVVGRRQAHRASELRAANAAAIDRNRTLGNELNTLTAANSHAQGRIARIDDDRRTTVARMNAVIGAWNAWFTANNALIEAANGVVDHAAAPSAAAVHAALDSRMGAVNAKEAGFRDAVNEFAATAAKTRQDSSSTKP
jgi:hypothetical protein